MADTPDHRRKKSASPRPDGAAEGTRPAPKGAHLQRLLVDGVRDYAIFALDPDGYVLTWNVGAERINGYTADEIIGQHFSRFYSAEEVARGKPARELEVAAHDGRFEEEGWRIRKDGGRFWASVVVTALRDEAGTLLGFAKITRDLTERRRAALALRQSEERFRLLIESVQDYAIFMLDPDGRVASWNAGAERIKGYTADEIIGQHFSRFYPQEKIAEDFPGHELAEAARVGRFEDEGWRVRKDGMQFWANVVITALRGDDGTLLGFAKVTRDLTARRGAEKQAQRLAAEAAARTEAERRSDELQRLSDELQQQARTLEEQAMELEAQTEEAQALTEEVQQTNEQLEHALSEVEQERASAQQAARAAAEAAQQAADANRAKTEFLAAMSHELRTPLNAIGGYADLLLAGVRGSVTREQEQDIERIRRNQQHLLAVITDILNYARLEAGQVTYEIKPVVLAAVVETVSALIEPLARARGVTVERGPCDAGAVARADQTKVAQILLNLLSNAAKFTPSGGRATISCAARGDRVMLTVADTGPGVAPDQRSAVFEPFVQLGRSLTSNHEGSGLGLAISRDLARAMGGDLTLDDSAGGASFTLALPAAQHAEPEVLRAEEGLV
jgi:PAS domain S-box-containing protein